MPHPADPAPRGRPRTTDASPARWPSPTHTHRVTGPQPARTHTLGLGQKVRRFFETIGCDSEEKYSKTIGRRTENYTNMLVRERGRYYSASIFCAVDAKKLVHSCRSAAGFGDTGYDNSLARRANFGRFWAGKHKSPYKIVRSARISSSPDYPKSSDAIESKGKNHMGRTSFQTIGSAKKKYFQTIGSAGKNYKKTMKKTFGWCQKKYLTQP